MCHLGTAEEGEAFFGSRWPEVTALSDPEQRLYAAFGLGRGTLSRVVGPRALLASGRALFQGNFAGKPNGVVMVMSGAFLFRGDLVLWNHDYKHSGDHPDWTDASRFAGDAGED